MQTRKQTLKMKFVKLLVLSLLLSSVLTMGFNKIMGKDITLIVDGEEKKIMTYSTTVGDFLNTQKIELKNDQVVTPSIDSEITSDMDIVIVTKKNYKITDGDKIAIRKAVGSTVSEILENLNINLSEHDVVTPALNEKVKPESKITIERVKKESYIRQQEIPFNRVEQKDDTLYEGENNIVQAGVVGITKETVQNTYVNGKLVSIDILNSENVQAPVDEIVKVGTKKIVAKGLEGKKVKAVYTLQATAYDPTAGTKTAMGTRARVGAVAVDPKLIPLGSKLYIESMDSWPSYGYAVAEDTGGAIKGKRIDLFFNTNAQANKFGRRNVKVYVLE